MDFPSGSWSISSVGSCSMGSFSSTRLLWHSQLRSAWLLQCTQLPSTHLGQCGRLPRHQAPALRRLLQLRAVRGKKKPAALLSTAWAVAQQSAFSEIPPCEQLFPRFPRIYCQDSRHSKFSAIQGIMGGTFSGSQTWGGGEFFFGCSISVLGLGCCWSVHLLFLCSSKFSLLLSSQCLLNQIPRFFILNIPCSIYCMVFVSD